jgi:DNA repair ATPase RecN
MTAQDLINPDLSHDLIKAAGIIRSYLRQAKLQPEEAERLRKDENELRSAAKQIGLIFSQQILDNLASAIKNIGEATEQLEEASGKIEKVKEFLSFTAHLVSLVGNFMNILK